MALDEIIDGLYALPPSGFTAARDEAVKALRKAGERDAAARVKALRKPTAAAAAVNRLVRERRADVEEFLAAAADLRDAQFSGKGDLGAATRREQAALAQLVSAGGEEVRPSLLAAAVDDEAARQVLEGRLAHELEPAGFGTLLAHVTPGGKRLKPAPKKRAESGRGRASRESPAEQEPRPMEEPAPKQEPAPDLPPRERPDEGAARARLDDARAALEAAEAEERQARRHWDDTRRELAGAQEAVDEALHDLDRLGED